MWDGYPFFPLRKDFPLEGLPSEMPDVAFTKVTPLEGGVQLASGTTVSSPLGSCVLKIGSSGSMLIDVSGVSIMPSEKSFQLPAGKVCAKSRGLSAKARSSAASVFGRLTPPIFSMILISRGG
jgi:hypothetical protein